jgi:hypothetical protein
MKNNTGFYQNFQGGQIYWNDKLWKGFVLLWGPISDKYGGTYSKMGFPTSNQYNTSDKGICQNFEGGTICEKDPPVSIDSRSNQERAIDAKAVSLGSNGASGLTSLCSMPAKYYTNVQGGNKGVIVWNGNKAVYIKGGMFEYYDSFNDKCTRFGLPTGEIGRIDNNKGKGWYQHFEKANIYLSDTNQKVRPGIVEGKIRDYFEARGGVSNENEMGWPEGSQWGATSYTCNSGGISGTIQDFTNGRIYQSSLGTIYIPWSEWNWINHYENVEGGLNNLGWPKTAKVNENGVERMYFEKGYLEGRWWGVHWGLAKVETMCDVPSTLKLEDQIVFELNNLKNLSFDLNYVEEYRRKFIQKFYDLDNNNAIISVNEIDKILSDISERYTSGFMKKENRQLINALYISLLRTKRYIDPLSYTDLDVLADGTEFIIKNFYRSGYTNIFKLQEDITLVFSSRRGSQAVVDQNGSLSPLERETFYIGRLGDTGFNNIYRDSKYYQYDPKYMKSNQVFHLIGGGFNFQVSGDKHCYYAICLSTPAWMVFHETMQKLLSSPSPTGEYGTSWEDLLLNQKGIDIGEWFLSTNNMSQLPNEFHKLRDYEDYCRILSRLPNDPTWDISCSLINENRLLNYTNSNENPKE